MKTMKKLMAVAIVAGAPVAASAVEVSGNVTMASDYSFRGVSQTNTKGAIQGGFDVDFGNGFYAGTWASNVEYFNTTQEIDVYAGYAFDVTEGVNLDLTVIQYMYPGRADFNYNEYALSVGYAGFTLGYVYSPDYFGEDQESADIVSLDYSLMVNEKVSVDFHLGHTKLGQEAYYDTDDDYTDYSIAANYDVSGVTLTLAYVGTEVDMNSAEAAGLGLDLDNYDDRFIFSVSKSL